MRNQRPCGRVGCGLAAARAAGVEAAAAAAARAEAAEQAAAEEAAVRKAKEEKEEDGDGEGSPVYRGVVMSAPLSRRTSSTRSAAEGGEGDAPIGPDDVAVTPVAIRRFKSSDVTQAVGRVLMPKLLEHNGVINTCKRRMRLGELTPRECKAMIHESSRQFNLRYAEAVQLAKQLANDTGVVKLRRLASSDNSWALAKSQSILTASINPDSPLLEEGATFVPGGEGGSSRRNSSSSSRRSAEE